MVDLIEFIERIEDEGVSNEPLDYYIIINEYMRIYGIDAMDYDLSMEDELIYMFNKLKNYIKGYDI